MGAAAHLGLPDGLPDPAGPLARRQVLSAGAIGIASLTLPAATAAASESVTPAFSGSATMTFTEVTETGFTVSWTGV